MQEICYRYLKSNPELANFVRSNPIWYRYLTRDPSMIRELPKEANKFYGRTWPQKVERWNEQLQMVDMLIQMVSAMKD